VFDVFDLVPLNKFGLFEVDRKEEFSPLKNGPGSKEDNPATSKRDVLLQGRRWVEAAGGVVLDDVDKETGVEISPLVSYAGEGLEFIKGKEIRAPAATADRGVSPMRHGGYQLMVLLGGSYYGVHCSLSDKAA
jgi:UDP-N-acetylglucosamine/UDP-N-acetylgalactosamine diphosphorylase